MKNLRKLSSEDLDKLIDILKRQAVVALKNKDRLTALDMWTQERQLLEEKERRINAEQQRIHKVFMRTLKAGYSEAMNEKMSMKKMRASAPLVTLGGAKSEMKIKQP